MAQVNPVLQYRDKVCHKENPAAPAVHMPYHAALLAVGNLGLMKMYSDTRAHRLKGNIHPHSRTETKSKMAHRFDGEDAPFTRKVMLPLPFVRPAWYKCALGRMGVSLSVKACTRLHKETA